MRAIQIAVPARVHFGLANLGPQSRRLYGGAGLALWHARTIIRAEPGPRGTVSIEGVPDAIRYRTCDILRNIGLDGVRLSVTESPARHVGLGTGTSLSLGLLEAASMMAGRPSLSKARLAQLSGRGGASGIGINSYFLGGLIGDSGHQRRQDSEVYLPSSARTPRRMPSPIFRIEWPESWATYILRRPEDRGLEGGEEKRFMARHTPVSEAECAMVARALLFELPAAVLDVDLDGVKEAFLNSAAHGFKRVEVARVGGLAHELARLNAKANVAATMSSFGPTLFVATADADSATFVMEFARSGFEVVSGAVANTGRLVEASDEDSLSVQVDV